MADLAEPIEKGSPADLEASFMYLAELCLGVSANRHSSFVDVISPPRNEIFPIVIISDRLLAGLTCVDGLFLSELGVMLCFMRL
jgi:hypothetical protein